MKIIYLQRKKATLQRTPRYEQTRFKTRSETSKIQSRCRKRTSLKIKFRSLNSPNAHTIDHTTISQTEREEGAESEDHHRLARSVSRLASTPGYVVNFLKKTRSACRIFPGKS